MLLGKAQDQGEIATLAALRPQWVKVLNIETAPLLFERYAVTGLAMYLVRPDGCIAYRAPHFDAAPLEGFLKTQYELGLFEVHSTKALAYRRFAPPRAR